MNAEEEELTGVQDIVKCNETGPTTEYVDGNPLVVGARFNDSSSFKHALRTQAITSNFGFKFTKSDKNRVLAACSNQGCSWRVRAILCEDGHTFEVRKVVGTHSCPGVNRSGNRQATSEWVANEIQDVVKRHPEVPPKQLKHGLETTYGLLLPYMTMWRGREQAREKIFGLVDENYKWVPTLTAELLRRNPGSHITYTYDSDGSSFKRLYVSFKVCIDGFLGGCRYLVGLDACHLKSKYLGVLLSANSLDGNNGLFTLAFAIVESESRSTWDWFLSNFLESIGFDLYPLAFISDMEKGLAEATRHIFPNAEHRVCLHHLWKNLKKYFHCQEGQRVKNLVWTAANACTTPEYHSKLVELCNVSPQVHSYLISLPYKWSKCQFLLEVKHESNTNNLSESFNSWISEARSKPVVDLVDMLRGMLMEQRASRKMLAANWRGELVPHVEEYIRDITTRKEHFIIRKSAAFKAEVEGRHERQEVDIHKME